MPANTDIKFYAYTNNNAPQLTNNYGCMIDVLDACLVNGFGAQSVSTLKATANVITVNFGVAHNFLKQQTIKITGANQSEFNGEHRILSVPNATSLTYEIANTASVAQATGTIVCSLPSLGWEKPFNSVATNGTGGKAAYRSTNLLLARRPFLRVVDELDPAYSATYAKYAKVGLVEDMTDINTMLGVQAPYDSANPDKNWVGTGSGGNAINGWAKWYYARANGYQVDPRSDTDAPVNGNRVWYVVGNSDFFYLISSPNLDFIFNFIYGFGTFKSFHNTDIHHQFLSATLIYEQVYQASVKPAYTPLAINNQTLLLHRPLNQDLTHNVARCISISGLTPFDSGSINYLNSYAEINRLCYAHVVVLESKNLPRGEMPNLYWNMQQSFDLGYFEDDNKLLMRVPVACSQGKNGTVFFDLGEL